MGRNKIEKDSVSGFQNYFQQFYIILVLVVEITILNALQIVSLLLQKSDKTYLKLLNFFQMALNKILKIRDNFQVKQTFIKIKNRKTMLTNWLR